MMKPAKETLVDRSFGACAGVDVHEERLKVGFHEVRLVVHAREHFLHDEIKT